MLEERYKFSKNKKSSVPMSKESKRAKAEFIKKWPNEPSTKLNCFICDSDSFELISEIDRYGFYYPTGICNKCGNVQQVKYYSDVALADFYTNFFRKIYETNSPRTYFTWQYNGRGKRIFNLSRV